MIDRMRTAWMLVRCSLFHDMRREDPNYRCYTCHPKYERRRKEVIPTPPEVAASGISTE